MTVTPSGSTTNFSGVGAPNPKLFLPSLDQVEEPVATILRTMLNYINNLIAPSGGGAYLSLTGPGETTTPGALTQRGPFTVADSQGNIILDETSPGGVAILTASSPASQVEVGTPTGAAIFDVATGNVEINSAGSIAIGTGSTQGVELQSAAGIEIVSAGSGASGPQITLFTHGADPNGVVTSTSKGDLCVDTSTPGLWQATAAASTVWTAL